MTQPLYKRDTFNRPMPDGQLLAKAKAIRAKQAKLLATANNEPKPGPKPTYGDAPSTT